ncbi:ABC transporter ATP-binding protein [Herbiconiux aconitum]|uniref:ABC transporter ATP-binding protein n=1 Tax=Herbiconiux aconitum TaxID=2970913 RepID=UPI0027E098D4|nr:ABC transporter ATP-binding protein [Herbiconiux aconitum]
MTDPTANTAPHPPTTARTAPARARSATGSASGPATTPPVLSARGLTRVFTTPAGEVRACDDISFDVAPGELVVVRGPSGAGKTTLLNLVGTLDQPTSGSIEIDGVAVAGLDADSVARLRRDALGFVFQGFGLLDVLTAAENVEVPLRLRRTDAAERDARVREALRTVGLADHADQLPDELSGGQQQRVGIARALVANPRLLLADEPTGQLDSQNAQIVMDLIAELVHQRGVAAVVATHDPVFAARADRVIELRDGRQQPRKNDVK